MTTPHPLDSLLSAWSQVTEGQRQAIARDFHLRTGGLMSTQAFPMPELLVVVPLATSDRPTPVLLSATPVGACLPSTQLRPNESLAQAAARIFEPLGLVPDVQPLGYPCVVGACLALAVSAQPYTASVNSLPTGWSAGLTLSRLAAAHHHQVLATWQQLSPLRLPKNTR